MCNSGLLTYINDLDDDMFSDISDVVLPWGNDDNISIPCSEHSCATYFDITDEKHTSQILSDLRKNI